MTSWQECTCLPLLWKPVKDGSVVLLSKISGWDTWSVVEAVRTQTGFQCTRVVSFDVLFWIEILFVYSRFNTQGKQNVFSLLLQLDPVHIHFHSRWTGCRFCVAMHLHLSTFTSIEAMVCSSRVHEQPLGGTVPFSQSPEPMWTNRVNRFSTRWPWPLIRHLFFWRHSFLDAILVYNRALLQHTQRWGKANLSTQLSKRGDFAWADGDVHWCVESVSMSVGIWTLQEQFQVDWKLKWEAMCRALFT